MKQIGLDFGTTNSTIAFCVGDDVRTFRWGGVGPNDYIPSIVSHERNTENIEIGSAAKQHLTEPSIFEAHARFKLFLAETNRNKLESNGFYRSPYDVAEVFLHRLLRDYEQMQLTGEKIERLVLTVPEIWVKEHKHTARECLDKICQSFRCPSIRFLSEPVAASAYFCHTYRQRHKKSFVGHVLVVDYGGGTLDISLSCTDEHRINVIETTGRGYDPDAPGSAGVAFDEAVIWQAHGRISRSEPLYHELMNDFELKKIAQQNRVDQLLDLYLREQSVLDDSNGSPMPTSNYTIFHIGADKIPVRPEHMILAFRERIESPLRRAFGQMLDRMNELGIDSDDREKLRVVLVGGFSRFYLVRKVIREMLDAKLDKDPRFDTGLSLEDTSLAIAKGAALVSAEKIEVIPMCPIGVGFRVWSKERDNIENSVLDDPPLLQRNDVWLLERGKPVCDGNPRFYSERLRIRGEINQSPKLLVDTGNGLFYIDIKRSYEKILPNAIQKDNTWQVGLSVDENLIFRFHASDISLQEQITTLGSIMDSGFEEVL